MLLGAPPEAGSIPSVRHLSSISVHPAPRARTEYRVRASARLCLDAGAERTPGALGLRVDALCVVLRLYHDGKTFWGVVSGPADLEGVSLETENSYLPGAVLLLVLVFFERRQREPMIDLSLFRIGAFAVANVATFFL